MESVDSGRNRDKKVNEVPFTERRFAKRQKTLRFPPFSMVQKGYVYLSSSPKYRKYTGPIKETTFNNEEITFNHDKAMSGVSKGYYTEYDNSYYYLDGETINGYVVYKELHDTKTERHSYKMYGDATDISYVPKWF